MTFLSRRHRIEPSRASTPLRPLFGGPVAPTAGRELAAEAPSAPDAVPLTWLAVPTLDESGGQGRVAGTSFHQELLAATARELRRHAVALVTVQLAVQEHGSYAGAVGVYLHGRRAGSVPATHLDAYRPVVAALTEQGRPATCRGALYSWDSDPADGFGPDAEPGLRFGLSMLQPQRPRAAPPAAPFLPPELGVRVHIDQWTAERLDAALPSRAKRFVHRRVGEVGVAGSYATLLLDGEVVGRLEDDDVLAPVRAAQASGFPLTCAVRVIRDPDRPVRVAADLPRAALV